MNFKHRFRAKLLVLSISAFLALCHAVDTITAKVSLSGDQTITSANGLFELGFFKPDNTSNYYMGIWYKIIPSKTVVWVANRDKPITDKYSSSLRMSDDGNLVLVTNMSKSPIWSTNLSSSLSKSTEAVLLDKGNLVLRGESNSSPPLWQSFDHPTNTLLPGARVGFNKRTNWTGALTSWKNSEDPASGLYTVECDPNATQFVMLWNKTEEYWNSGVWIPDQGLFSLMPELRYLPSSYSFSYVHNENESYLTFDCNSTSFLPRFVIDVSGIFKGLTWFINNHKWIQHWSQPGQECQVHAHCGAFGSCNENSPPFCHCLPGFEPKSASQWNISDYSGGCARKTKLKCENPRDKGGRDKFWVSTSMALPDAPHFVSTYSLKDCELVYLKNCSCTAYAYDKKVCWVWFGDLLNVKQVPDTDANGKTLYVRLAASEIQTSGHKKWLIGLLVSLLIGFIVLSVLVSVVYWRKKMGFLMTAKSMGSSFTRFRHRDLQYATRNFSERLGEGGFGTVFKGTLPDSTVIAVKKLERIGQGQGEKQFKTEVSAIGTIQHVNLVRLCGFCSEGAKRLLVYEYMPNGSLDTHLFRKEGSEILSWKVRYQIAIGIAKGLAYLHEKCRDCIIHCDIKPENILLDADFCPKVADFGLAKLLGREFSRVLTTMRGTRGYLAPEWISGEAITAKVDVYSYGMMLFELVSGRRNIQQASDGSMNQYFPNWALMKIAEGEDVLSVVDPRLEGDAERDEVMRMSKLACWCIQDEINQRPTMGLAVQVLEGVCEIDMPLLPRSLEFLADDDASICF